MVESEIISKATQYVAEEMGVALRRSAISPNIRERMDHSCAVLDRDGRIVAQAEHIPVHLGSFRVGARNIMSWLQVNHQTLRDGDMLITNDPYISGTHMNDVALIAPVYFKGEIWAYVINKAHNVDVGGPVFGSLNPDAKNLFQEGLIIPPVRILKNGTLDPDVFSFIVNNFKDPDTANGDINAQIAANRTGISRVREIFERFGLEDVTSSWDHLIKGSRDIALSAISGWKQGKFSSEDYLETNYGNVVIKATVEVRNDGILVDFSGTSPQIEYPINAVPGVTFSATAFAIRSALNVDVPTNEGFYSIIDVEAAQGSLLNPDRPHPVSGGNVETTQRIADVILHALSGCVPGDIPSASSGTMFNIMLGGDRGNGKYWSYYETIGGGNGASRIRPGVSGVHSNMTNTLNTPIEVAEREYPMFFTSYTLRRGSGGKGLMKGGDGVIRSFRVLKPSTLSVIADRFKIPPYALMGGRTGKTGALLIVHSDGKRVKCPSKCIADLNKNDEVIVMTPGGSGYGVAGKRNDHSTGKAEAEV